MTPVLTQHVADAEASLKKNPALPSKKVEPHSAFTAMRVIRRQMIKCVHEELKGLCTLFWTISFGLFVRRIWRSPVCPTRREANTYPAVCRYQADVEKHKQQEQIIRPDVCFWMSTAVWDNLYYFWVCITMTALHCLAHEVKQNMMLLICSCICRKKEMNCVVSLKNPACYFLAIWLRPSYRHAFLADHFVRCMVLFDCFPGDCGERRSLVWYICTVVKPVLVVLWTAVQCFSIC